MTYLPLTIQASSDGVANEPGIGGSGCGARTMTPLRSYCAPIEFQGRFWGGGTNYWDSSLSEKSFTLRPLRVAMSVVYALLE